MLQIPNKIFSFFERNSKIQEIKKIAGTLVRRGTPVEKHWSRG